MRRRVTLEFEGGGREVISGVTGFKIEDEPEYYVIVMFSDDSKHKLYKYACNVTPRLNVGDVVRASVNEAAAKVKGVVDQERNVRLGSVVENCDVIWRKPSSGTRPYSR